MTTYSKLNLTAGTSLTAAHMAHLETQYEDLVAEAAAGNISMPTAAIVSGQFPLGRMPRATSGYFLKALGTGTDPAYVALAVADMPALTKTLVLHAAGGKPRSSNGCAPLAWTESSTNKIMTPSLDFDKAIQEHAQWTVDLPDGYTGGNLTAKFRWTAGGGTVGQAVIWGIQARSFTDDDAIDQALGTAAEVTDALLATGDEHVTSAVTLTPAGSPAGGKRMVFQVYRKAADASDTLDADARLIEVKLEFPSSYSD